MSCLTSAKVRAHYHLPPITEHRKDLPLLVAPCSPLNLLQTVAAWCLHLPKIIWSQDNWVTRTYMKKRSKSQATSPSVTDPSTFSPIVKLKMRSIAACFVSFLAACSSFYICVHPSSIPVDSLEQVLSASTEASPAPPSLAQSLNLEGSWSDVLRQSIQIGQQSLGARHAITGAELRPPSSQTAASLLHLPEYTPEQREQMLKDVQVHLHSMFKVQVTPNGPLHRPYRGDMDPSVFGMIIRKLTLLHRIHGMFPFQVGSQTYLLEHARAQNLDFRRLNGFNAEFKEHVWYNVYRQMDVDGSKGTYQFVGAVRGPHVRRNRKHRDQLLMPSAVRLSQIRALSGSIFKAHVQPHTN